MSYFTHRFSASIASHHLGKYHYSVVFLPDALANELTFDKASRLRIETDVSGIPLKCALQPSAGWWYFMLPKAAMKVAELGIGSPVEVAFKLVPSDAVELPPELADLLKSDQKVSAAWAGISAGKQRGLAIMIDSAKRAETRHARLEQVSGILLGLRPWPWVMRQRTVS